jgi:murein DD-endopeptidase MepM/ murein hydrolase activator NlpD
MNLIHFLTLLLTVLETGLAETFVLPSPNRALFKEHGEQEYFVPTPGKEWISGTFGCVRSDGHQFHEGLDIKCTQRDRHGEPSDPVYASGPGRVAYMNESPALSNYGKYIILEHEIEGMLVFTTYAHLSAFAAGLKIGDKVQQGQVIATMGRTSNTHQAITKDRAHVHFEIDLRLNDRFAAWHKEKLVGQHNDHGNWNGRNMAGVDPRLVLLDQQRLGPRFSLLDFIKARTELCRVVLRETHFSWLKTYAPLVRRNPVAEKEGIAGYEIVLDYTGLPFQLIPRAKSEIGTGPKVQLLSVSEPEANAHSCRKLVTKHSGHWQLANNGLQLLDLLAY